jgi:antibiotic biosynthesis monooxygenase (ABM) superfamily enzyme
MTTFVLVRGAWHGGWFPCQTGGSPVEYQLRSYRVKPGEMDEWVAEWKERVYPVRQNQGFLVVGAWTVEDDDRFVWILGYDGPESFADADAAYYASPERSQLTPDPARHLDEAEHKMMRSVLGT